MGGEVLGLSVFLVGVAFMAGWACGFASGGRPGVRTAVFSGTWLALLVLFAVVLVLGGEGK